MGLPLFNTTDRILAMLQTRWSTQLDPIVENPLLKGSILKDVILGVGDNLVNHKLQRIPQGYIVVNMKNIYSEIYSKESPMPTLTLLLNSSVAVVADILVF